MVEFKTAYYNPMDRAYEGNNTLDIAPEQDIEKPVMDVSEIGQTVTEGPRVGHLIQSATAAIRAGAGKIELQTQMESGQEPAGAESYGKEARREFREMARANEVLMTSVHTPTNIANLSGFNPQERSFNPEFRKAGMDEVKKAIKFAAEATQGGAVVVHTGEYQRPIFDAPWNKGEFVGYDEEPTEAIKPLVDDRTGRVIAEVRMNQLVPRAVWNRYGEGNEFYEKNNGSSYTDENGNIVKPGDYVDYEGRKVDRANRVPVYDKENNTFKIRQEKWEDLVKEAEDINRERADKSGMSYNEFIRSGRNDVLTPEEAFLYATTETQEAIAKGWAGNFSGRLDKDFETLEKLKKARKFYEKLEENIPEEEKWKIKKQIPSEVGDLVPPEHKNPTEVIDEMIKRMRSDIEQRREMVTGQLQSAEEQKIIREHSLSTKKYALKRTLKSYAELGVNAMVESESNPYARRDIFVAPENIFPEMGYGSHPEETIELVKNARKEMVEYLTKPQIEDPSGKVDEKGNPVIINNPYYRAMSQEQAEKEAKDHIKATLDTQHLGMWFKHFKPLPNETEQKRRDRFNNWYMDEIKKMAKEDIIGNIHLVDSLGGGHQHIPAGQGDLPLVEAISYLKKKGYKGYINSEAFGEERFGQGRILLETWKTFGSPISKHPYVGFGGAPPMQRWTDIEQSYFGRTYPPYFIFGAYSPSNDWTLWSQVPME